MLIHGPWKYRIVLRDRLVRLKHITCDEWVQWAPTYKSPLLLSCSLSSKHVDDSNKHRVTSNVKWRLLDLFKQYFIQFSTELSNINGHCLKKSKRIISESTCMVSCLVGIELTLNGSIKLDLAINGHAPLFAVDDNLSPNVWEISM